MEPNDGVSLDRYMQDLDQMDLLPWSGAGHRDGRPADRIAAGPRSAIGDFCEISTGNGRSIRTQVIGFRNGRVLAMPLDEPDGLQLGSQGDRARSGRPAGGGTRTCSAACWTASASPWTAGRPSKPRPPIRSMLPPPNPLQRRHITDRLVTGIRAIDSLLTCGKGQRIGLFGGSGVGKSTLLGAMSRKNSAQVSVVALIGERNREVKAFLEHELGPEGMKRSVVVVATSDRPAPLRIRAAFVALAAAEYFRDQGADVLLVMDSVTRLAMAQREIGLAAGRAAQPEGIHALGVYAAPENLRTRGKFRNRIDHRILHGAGGRRRFQRADLRRRSRDSGRPFDSVARAGRRRPLSRHRRPELDQPPGQQGDHARKRFRPRRESAKRWRSISSRPT